MTQKSKHSLFCVANICTELALPLLLSLLPSILIPKSGHQLRTSMLEQEGLLGSTQEHVSFCYQNKKQ